MKLRLASTRDLPCIVEIINTVVPLMQAAGNPQWDESYPQLEHFATDIELEQLWVAVDDADSDCVVGVGALTTDQPDDYAAAGCDLSKPSVVPHRMAVSPSYQGRGVAQMFLSKAEELARARGFEFVRIDTNKCNKVMQKVIPKAGFTFMKEITLTGKPDSWRFLCYEKKIL
jgi:GNAT superfamily N-acetyltransferase